jgi:putative phosphoesterase
VKVALLSDIHANAPALEAVYADMDSVGIERILVIGDLIGYYYWPREVVSRLIGDPRVTCIRGNHEDILAECLADEAASARYRAKYGSGYQSCADSLDGEMLGWLAALPVSREVTIDGVSFHMSHGGLGETDTYIYPDTSSDELLRNYSACSFTVFGHTHYPFVHYHDRRVMINPGSVGQARDRGGAASYAIVDLENLVVRPRRVPFDVAAVIEAARDRDPGLPYLQKILER